MDRFREFFTHILGRVRNTMTNPYFLVLVIAGVWMLFFDKYNLISQYKMQATLDQLVADKAYYQQAIRQVDYRTEALMKDDEELERFARERYRMKRRNEDVFVIVKN